MCECNNCKIDKLREKVNNHKREQKENEFDEMYEKYKQEFDKASWGLIETNKVDFLKQYIFFSTTIQPIIDKYVEAFLGKRK